jgi:hypothetical protein
MSERTLEAIVASPPERDDLVVQLFIKDGGQWGEVFSEGDSYIIELYERNGIGVRRFRIQDLTGSDLREVMQSLGWNVDVDEGLHVVNLAVRELATRKS